jgi:hypothetical protein
MRRLPPSGQTSVRQPERRALTTRRGRADMGPSPCSKARGARRKMWRRDPIPWSASKRGREQQGMGIIGGIGGISQHEWFCSEDEAQAAGFRKSYRC